ncbi:hypothetical protein DL96DRAFT_1706085 [Flagelloscypha sp. PMI_526]|nr:hypothetical protein DL96DRAFT_1706085 [Flagelloscypha sp. PMI_526]
MSGSIIIVDDEFFTLADPNQWSVGGIHREFNARVLLAMQSSASWTYDFVGSSVEVLGTIPHGVAPSDTVTVTFSLDGSKVTDFTSPANFTEDSRHQPFFRSSDFIALDPTIQHRLQVTQQNLPPPPKFSLLFDYLLYSSSPSSKFTEDSRAVIDERDSQVSFSNVGGGDVVSSEAYLRGTATQLSRTDQIGRISFNGSKIEVYGCVLGTNSTEASYTINRQVDQTISVSPSPEFNLNVRLYSSEELDAKEPHTLTIQWVNGGPLCIDYFLVTPPPRSQGDMSFGSPNLSETGAQNNRASLSSAAIGGIAAGISVLLLGTALVMFIIWKKRREKDVHLPANFTVHSYPNALATVEIHDSFHTEPPGYFWTPRNDRARAYQTLPFKSAL